MCSDGIAAQRGFKSGRSIAYKQCNFRKFLGTLLTVGVFGNPESYGGLTGELGELSHYSVTVVIGAHGSGVTDERITGKCSGCTLHQRVGGNTLDCRHKTITIAAEDTLKMLANDRRDTVHLYLRVTIVHYPVSLVLLLCAFK